MTQENTQLHPVGEYPAELKQVAVGKGQTGTEFIGLVFQSDHGKLSMQLWLSVNAASITKDQLWQNLEWEAGRDSLADLRAKIGTQCRVKVAHESYRDKMQVKVAFAGLTTIYDDRAAEEALARAFGAAVKTPTGQTAETEDDDDNVVF